MPTRTTSACTALISAVLLSVARNASADVTVTGSVLPGNPGDPWAPTSTLLVGGWIVPPPPDEYSGEITVSNRGTLTTPGATIGAKVDFQGSVTIEGYGSRWINHGAITLADGSFSSGSVVIRQGAQVSTDDLVVGSRGVQACAQLHVEGYDATLISTGTAVIGRSECDAVLELKDGGSFFSNNVHLATNGDTGAKVLLTGYGTRWVSTGEFIVGMGDRAEVEIDYKAKLSTVNAQIAGDWSSNGRFGKVHVSGWDAAWTNQGLLRIGYVSNGALTPGSGELSVGADGTLETENVQVSSELGNAFIHVDGLNASWYNAGDVSILGDLPAEPSLVIDNDGQVCIDGLLSLVRQKDYPSSANVVARLGNGDLNAGAIEAPDCTFEFAGGRLNTASFTGDLDNTHVGTLVVGGDDWEYPSTSILGDYTQGDSATLSLTVAAPSETPLLDVGGSVCLDGQLLVRAAAGAAPFQAGDTVTLLRWSDDLMGSFAQVSITLPLAPGLAWDTSELYTTGQIHAVPAH